MRNAVSRSLKIKLLVVIFLFIYSSLFSQSIDSLIDDLIKQNGNLSSYSRSMSAKLLSDIYNINNFHDFLSYIKDNSFKNVTFNGEALDLNNPIHLDSLQIIFSFLCEHNDVKIKPILFIEDLPKHYSEYEIKVAYRCFRSLFCVFDTDLIKLGMSIDLSDEICYSVGKYYIIEKPHVIIKDIFFMQ